MRKNVIEEFKAAVAGRLREQEPPAAEAPAGGAPADDREVPVPRQALAALAQATTAAAKSKPVEKTEKVLSTSHEANMGQGIGPEMSAALKELDDRGTVAYLKRRKGKKVRVEAADLSDPHERHLQGVERSPEAREILTHPAVMYVEGEDVRIVGFALWDLKDEETLTIADVLELEAGHPEGEEPSDAERRSPMWRHGIPKVIRVKFT